MPDYKYLIIGGGMTGMLLFTVLRAVDRAGLHRPDRRRIAPPLQPSAAVEGTLERQAFGYHLAQRRRVGRYLPPRTDSPDRGCEKQESDR